MSYEYKSTTYERPAKQWARFAEMAFQELLKVFTARGLMKVEDLVIPANPEQPGIVSKSIEVANKLYEVYLEKLKETISDEDLEGEEEPLVK